MNKLKNYLNKVLNNDILIIIDDEKLITALTHTSKTHKVSVEEMIFIILYDYLEIE